jgi:hypothetical protein
MGGDGVGGGFLLPALKMFAVNQRVCELDGGCKLIPPKTEAAKRILLLTPNLIEMLRSSVLAQQAERLQWGLDWHEHGLVFPAENAIRKYPATCYAKISES